MPIIIISSELAAPGKEISEGTAKSLGYQVLGTEIISDIASRYDVPANTLAEALETPPAAWQWKRSRR